MNRATRTIVATLGVVFGLSGMSHGFFETLQGSTATNGLFIAAIGEAHRMWLYGSEYAFTLIPNFLITGVAAMLVSLAIAVWSLGFAQKRQGPTILLLLFVLLLLVGGGVAQVLFFPWIWLVATRINKPLLWWKKVLPARMQLTPGKLWLGGLVTSTVLLVCALVIAVTGFVPAVSDPTAVLSVMLVCLGGVVLALPLTFISGFAHDIAVAHNEDL